MRWIRRMSLASLLILTPARVPAATFHDARSGYHVSHPDDWFVNREVLTADGPLIIANVPSEDYLHGGLLPPGGADISVQVLTADETPAGALARLGKDEKVVHEKAMLRGASTDVIEYEVDLGKPYTKVATSVMVGERLFLFQLMYANEDARPDEYRRVLREVVQSVKLEDAQ